MVRARPVGLAGGLDVGLQRLRAALRLHQRQARAPRAGRPASWPRRRPHAAARWSRPTGRSEPHAARSAPRPGRSPPPARGGRWPPGPRRRRGRAARPARWTAPPRPARRRPRPPARRPARCPPPRTRARRRLRRPQPRHPASARPAGAAPRPRSGAARSRAPAAPSMPPSAPPRPRTARPPTRRHRRRGSPAPARPTARPARSAPCRGAQRSPPPPARPRSGSPRRRPAGRAGRRPAPVRPAAPTTAAPSAPARSRRPASPPARRRWPASTAAAAGRAPRARGRGRAPAPPRHGTAWPRPGCGGAGTCPARRLLHEPPPLVGLGQQDLLHLALADHGVHLAAEAGVGQELHHVQPPHLGPVQVVLALAVAVEPPHHRHLVELDRQRAALVVEHQLDLADAGRLAHVGSAEQHVLSGRGPQLGRRLHGHRPLQGVGDVGLAAAVGPDHHGDPLVEAELDVLGERLEAPHAHRLQIHRAPDRYMPARAICSSASRAASCSDAFLLPPEPLPSSAPSTSATLVKRRSWSGPLVSTSA